jgi:hypothetical protein
MRGVINNEKEGKNDDAILLFFTDELIALFIKSRKASNIKENKSCHSTQ